jgi:uncharacterized membrane protein
MGIIIFVLVSLIVFMITHHIYVRDDLRAMEEVLFERSMNTRRRFEKIEVKLGDNLKLKVADISL